MNENRRLSANEAVLNECSEIHDVLTDTLSAFEDLYYEMETALEDISDSLESARHRLDDINAAFRRLQCRQRMKERRRVHFSYTPEPSEPYAPPFPIDEDDEEFYLPFPEACSDE